MKYLIVGLGNIGVEYELTRHNIGFLAIDRIADDLECPEFSQDRHSFVSTGKFKGRTIHLVKPTTYMNLSGKAVNYWMQELKVPVENLLIITDDVALDFGVIRIRKKGSAGGHNGLGHIEQVLGQQNYPRMRFGIGSNYHKGQQADYVLSRFKTEEMNQLDLNLGRMSDAIKAFCTVGIDRMMNQFNG